MTIRQLDASSQTQRPTAGQVYTALERAMPWLVWLFFLVIYGSATAPSIAALFDDTLEFQLVLPTFGIAHPTGYPLYTLLGGVWSQLLPVGNWAWRVNLFSAAAAAASVMLVFLLARRLTWRAGHGDTLAGAAAAIAFGFGPVWWAQATIAEVYALHNLFVAAILLVAVNLPPAGARNFDRSVTLLFGLIGLGLAHHRTTALVLPGVALYLLWTARTMIKPQRAWLAWALALLAPLLLYAYLPLRAAQGIADLNGSYVNSWAGFWDHVLARRYTSFFVANDLSQGYSWADWLALWVTQSGWLGAALSLLGLGMLAERAHRPAWTLVGLVLGVNLLFALNYRVADPEVFMLPVWLCAAVLTGGGLTVLRRLLPATRWATLLAGGVVVALAIGAGRGAPLNRSNDWRTHDYAVDMASVAFPPGARVIGIEGEMTALKYMQQAEGLGVIATPIVADAPDARRTAIADALAVGVAPFLTREVDGIAAQYSFTGEGPLVRVWPRGQVDEQTPSIQRELALLDGRLRLEGYDVARLLWAGGPVARVTLYWRPQQALDHNLKVSLRVVDGTGNPLPLADGAPAAVDAFPLRQVAPTTSWAPEAQVRDVYEIELPADPTGAQLLLIIYDGDTLAEAGRIEAPLP